jgi:hypothetical protein
MLPGGVFKDTVDTSTSDPERVGQLQWCSFALGVKFAYSFYILECQGCMAIAGHLSASGLTLLGNHIAYIIGCSAYKQMGGVTAGWIITTMKDKLIARKSAMVDQFIDGSVGGSHLDRAMNITIAKLSMRLSDPWPAFIRAALVDIGPETFFKRLTPMAVSLKKRHRLTNDMATLLGIDGGKFCALAATALAKSWLNSYIRHTLIISMYAGSKVLKWPGL